MRNLPDNVNAIPGNPDWADAADEQEFAIISAMDSCVFCADAEAIVDASETPVEAELTVTVKVQHVNIDDAADKLRDALAACVLLYDVRAGRAHADDRQIYVET